MRRWEGKGEKEGNGKGKEEKKWGMEREGSGKFFAPTFIFPACTPDLIR